MPIENKSSAVMASHSIGLLPTNGLNTKPTTIPISRISPIGNTSIATKKKCMVVNNCIEEDSGFDNKGSKKQLQLDYLDSCVCELNKNLACLDGASHQKSIFIETDNFEGWISINRVTLPSGNVIYAGYFGHRLVVSDRDCYYIDYAAAPPQMGFWAALTLLLSDLTGVCNEYHAYPRPRSTEYARAAAAPAATHRTAMGNALAGVAGLWGSAHGFKWRITQWIAGINDPLRFPQAGAQGVDHSAAGRQAVPIHRSEADWVIRLDDEEGPQYQDSKTNFSEPHVSGEREPIVTLPETTTAALNPLESEPLSTPVPRPLSLMSFTLNGVTSKLSLPNAEAKKAVLNIEHIFSKYQELAENPLKRLLTLDKYIGKKIVNIFHRGLFLKHQDAALDSIILKKQLESMIELFHVADINSHDRIGIGHYLKSQIKISDYLTHSFTLLAAAHQSIDPEIVIEVVKKIRHKSFEMAKEEVEKERKLAKAPDVFHLDALLKGIGLIEKARAQYGRLLTSSDDSTIDRAIYLNSRKVYYALINGDEASLADHLMILRYYSIFEYTRINGISIYTNNFLLPGELSYYGRIFTEDEIELTYQEIEKIFTAELYNLMLGNPKKSPNIDRVYKIIELTRLNEKHTKNEDDWKKKNFFYLEKTNFILKTLISAERVEKVKNSKHNEWYEDLQEKIKDAKTALALLAYIEEMQINFNDHLDYFIKNDIIIQRSTTEQHIASSKIAACLSLQRSEKQAKSKYSLLKEYGKGITSGNLDYLLRATAFWYLSQEKNKGENNLINQNVISVLKAFVLAQNLSEIKYALRSQLSFTSLYRLESSDKKEFLEDYYKQFIEYKLHDSFAEAQKNSVQCINASSLNYIDVIYPVKKIHMFKVYSRNYVENTLSAGNSHSAPADNIGYLCLIVPQSGKLTLLSTLIGFSFFNDISHLADHPLIQRLIGRWEEVKSHPDRLQPTHIAAEENDLLLLVLNVLQDNHELEQFLGLLLTPPEAAPAGRREPSYSLVPIDNRDVLSVIGPYMLHSSEMNIIGNPTMPLITMLDYINQATLIQLANKLKELLRHYTWLEYISHFIPFFKTLYLYWHDDEHQVAFHEIIFDIFDLTMLLISATAGIKKITETTIKGIINKAIEQKVPRHMIRQFFMSELILVAPEIGMHSLRKFAKEFVLFMNPVGSIPFSQRLFSKIKTKVQHDIKSRISFSNNIIKEQSQQKNFLRKYWRAEVDEARLTLIQDSIYIDESISPSRFYIKDDADYYQVIKHEDQAGWRLIHAQSDSPDNFAIPVGRTSAGKWIAMNLPSSDRRHSSISFYNLEQQTYTGLDIIQFEPAPTFQHIVEDLDHSTAFHKNILRFFLYHNSLVHQFLIGNATHAEFFDKFYSTLLFKKEILSFIQFDPNSHDAQRALLTLHDINARRDGVVRFRTIIAWRNEKDRKPRIHIALRIDINERKYIIDLYEMRAHLQPRQKQTVFAEEEWLLAYRFDAADEYELIKYKDFELYADARSLTSREAIFPSQYLQDGLLLREPLWYRPLLINGFNKINTAKHASRHRVHDNYLSAMRAMRTENQLMLTKEELPLQILYRCGKLNKESLVRLSHLVNEAKNHAMTRQDFFNVKQRITSQDELLKLQSGKLLAFYNLDGLLQHLLLCMGEGRFAGLGNHFFDPAIPHRITFIIAEHLGRFAHDHLKLHHDERLLQVYAGNGQGVEDDTPLFHQDAASALGVQDANVGRANKIKTLLMSRISSLLGVHCQLTVIYEDKQRLGITLSDNPFNINGLDMVEFSDILRGVPFIGDAQFQFSELEMIELSTCFGGYGGNYSMAQILADQFTLPVQLSPAIDQPEIKERRPEWFKLYQPLSARFTPAERAALHQPDNPLLLQAQQNQRRLHDLILLLQSKVDPLALSRQMRLFQYLPPIFMDIVQALISSRDYTPLQVEALDLSPASLLVFYKIRSEYGLTDQSEPQAALQATVDVISSVNDLKYLSNWFNATWLDHDSL